MPRQGRNSLHRTRRSDASCTQNYTRIANKQEAGNWKERRAGLVEIIRSGVAVKIKLDKRHKTTVACIKRRHILALHGQHT